MFDDLDSRADFASRPPDATETTVAALVRGDDMSGIAEDGDVIYWDDRRRRRLM